MQRNRGKLWEKTRDLFQKLWGKTRDLFQKLKTINGIFHAKMSTTKYRNYMDLTEAEDIKKRWQQYTEELYRKDLHDPDNHDGVITHLEPDTLDVKSSGS